jgi:tellurite resistance protein
MGPAHGHVCPGIDYASLFMKAFTVLALRGFRWSFPEQDMALDYSHLPPEHADGFRIIFQRETEVPKARASSAGAPSPSTPSETSIEMPVLGSDALMALASVAWADGTLAEEEAAALMRIARASGMSADAVGEVERATRERAIADGPLPLHGALAEHVYSLACLMAASDGTIDPRERAAVAALGDRLGLDERSRERASLASHAVAQSLGVSGKALAALAAEIEREASPSAHEP